MNWEIITFLGYFVILLGVALIFYFNGSNKNSEDFFLGGRSMGPWVTALSAQASDMSAWLLMGLPGSILAFGFGQMWIGIGLALGTAANWILCAKRLRTFSKAADDAITVPQYLTNRFGVDSRTLQLVCALIFLFAYTIYVASALVAGTSVFNTLFPEISPKVAMLVFLLIIVAYTFFGGFTAVCWTDFFQGMLMMLALMLVPIVVYFGHRELLDPTALTTVYGSCPTPPPPVRSSPVISAVASSAPAGRGYRRAALAGVWATSVCLTFWCASCPLTSSSDDQEKLLHRRHHLGSSFPCSPPC